ncbi:Transcription factor spt20 [Coemansia sp. BCRC 34301]|nr:Transcription factor spt20 [Coemansia sp. BCRC 34301]
MSTSVASGNSLKPHNAQRDSVAHMPDSRSMSPDADDQDSVIGLEEELQQELENEMSASYDNLFGDDDDDDNDDDDVDGDEGDLRSATGRSITAELDNDSDEVDADLFGDGSALDSDDDGDDDDDDDIDLNFEDPPVNAVAPKSTTLPSVDEEDSASDDEFEAVNVELAQALAESSAPTVPETSQQQRSSNHVHVGDRHFLERFKDEEPSMVLHMFDSHFRFEGQEGVFLYNGTMRFFFDALNEGKIPVDLVDVLAQLSCRYYEGCLIVEVRDYRRPAQEAKTTKHHASELLTWSAFGNGAHGYRLQPPAGAESPSARSMHLILEPGSAASGMLASGSQGGSSVGAKIFKKVLRPTSETLSLDLLVACDQSRTKLSQNDMLEIEGMLLLAVEEPLDLDPDFQVSRIANATRYIEYGHMLPRKRRKFNSAEIEAEQAEHEEKLKLMTLMNDRAGRSDFIPNFSRVAQIGDWRHKKYVSDAEVYPAALPPAPPLPPGKKAAAKRSRSQMSLFADGRRVIRTLRFVQTINGRSTHTVFHVLELPDNGGLQGIMRWGTLPDTSINGGSKVFLFPDEEVMRMHIDNFKLLLCIESNRLIYDSAYPNGVPTAGPPPSLTTPTISPRTSSNMVLATSANSTAGAGSSVAGLATAAPSPTIASSSVAPSPDIAAKASPATKAKASVAKKGSRKNSPQPKQKKSATASTRPSAEPEAGATTPKGSKAVAPKIKASGKAAAEANRQSGKEDSPASVDSAGSAAALAEAASPEYIEGECAPAAMMSAPTKTKKSASKASLASLSQATAVATENENETATAVKAAAKKKGAKASPKPPAAPKEKKPRAKPKAKSASVAPPSEAEALAASALAATDGADGVVKTSANDGGDDDVPLVQSPGSATFGRMSGDESAAAHAASNLLLSPSPAAALFPGIGSQAAALPLAQNMAQLQAQAMAQYSAHMARMAQGNPGRPAFEIPKHITKEFLQAHPEYYAYLRKYMTQAMAQAQLQQQQQQQQQIGASTMNGPSAGPMGSPQMHPSMTTMAQTMPNTQNVPGNSIPPGASPSMSAARAPTPGSSVPMAHANSALGSPAMRPALGPGAPSNMASIQQQQFQQQTPPTKEEMATIHHYCRLMGLQIQSLQDPRLPILIAKAKTGELRSMLMANLQALTAQRQQQMAAVGANPQIRPGGGGPNPMGMQQPPLAHGSAPIQNSPAPANSLPTNAATTAAQMMGMGQPTGAGLPQTARPMQLPRDPANPQDRAVLLEMLQRQRDAHLNSSSVAGAQMQAPGAPNQLQQPSALAAAMAAAALQQRQQQLGMAAGGGGAMASPSGSVSGIQTSMARPMQPPGGTAALQSRPSAPMMGSPANVPANAPQVISAGQRQMLQQAALANMTPQQQQELMQRVQQARQQAAMAPQQPQANVAMILQQLASGQLNPAVLPPQVIGFLLQHPQAQMPPEQRLTLQRILNIHLQQSQNNAASAGPIRPGAAQ